MKYRGFTVVELIVAVVVLAAIGTVFLFQRQDISQRNADTAAKSAINAIYYNLEYVYYPKNNAYPQNLVPSELTGLDPASLKDPNGKQIGESDSTFRYEGRDCMDNKCKGYQLRADLIKESDFIKNSIN